MVNVTMTLWTKCSDRMPPDDETLVILKSNNKNFYSIEGYMAHRMNNKSHFEWTPYTTELWSELNK